MVRGDAIYRDNCSACHGGKGEGTKMLFPALSGNQIVTQADPTTPARVVIAGVQGVHTAAAPPPRRCRRLAGRLDDKAIADALTYVRNSWGNAAPPVSPRAVARVRAATR